MLAGYAVEYCGNAHPMDRVVEVCNYDVLNLVKFYFWGSMRDMESSETSSTVAIFKIKPKCHTSSSQPQ